MGESGLLLHAMQRSQGRKDSQGGEDDSYTESQGTEAIASHFGASRIGAVPIVETVSGQRILVCGTEVGTLEDARRLIGIGARS